MNLLKAGGISLALMFAFLPLQGCAIAALTAAASYAASAGDEETEAFHKVNLEREKAGLRPLTKEEWEKRQTAGSGSRKKQSGKTAKSKKSLSSKR